MPASSVAAMVEKGYDTETVYSQRLQGATDGRLASICKEENRALVTLDLDFANIAAFPPHEYPGILVRRPHTQSVMVIQGLIQKLLSALEADSPTGSLWIIEPNQIRISSFTPVDNPE